MDALSSTATPLCFSRAEFTRSDFNVDVFLTSLRRRVSIEQIQEDLRIYLKILQNAMIELINQDYADFVNLSSNLVNLRVTVEKLGKDVGYISEEFQTSTKELESALESLGGYLVSKNKSRTRQSNFEEKIQLFSSLSRVKALIERRSTSRNVIERISHLLMEIRLEIKGISNEAELNLSQTAFQSLAEQFQKILDDQLVCSVTNKDKKGFSMALTGYEACDRRDTALAVFISEFVEPVMRKKLELSNPKVVQKLETVFSTLTSVWNDHSAFLHTEDISSGILGQNQVKSKELMFLNDCLLTVLLSVLETEFPNVLIPSDPDSFHAAYSSLVHFIRHWNSPSHSLLKMAAGKLSLTVYFRLRCHEIGQSTTRILASASLLPAKSSENLANSFQLEATESAVEAIDRLWSDEVYLPPLAAKFWDFCCKIIQDYESWIGRAISSKVEQNKKAKEPSPLHEPTTNGEVSTVSLIPEATKPLKTHQSNWKEFVILVTDASMMETRVFEIVFDKAWPKFKTLGAETSLFGQCLTAAFEGIKATSSKGIELITEDLSAEMGAPLAGASEIPRQYRWTRKESPTQPSSYLTTAFQILFDFKSFADSRFMGMPDQKSIVEITLTKAAFDCFLPNVRNVLDSVDKISSSLSRLKKGSAARLGSSANLQGQDINGATRPMTDDDKIRRQLSLDLSEFKTKANEFCFEYGITMDWSPLEQLSETAEKANEAVDGV